MHRTSHTPTETKSAAREARATAVSEPTRILARNIMSRPVVSVRPDTSVLDAARLLSENHFSAVPVVDRGTIVGIVTEGDFIRREELGTDPEYCSLESTDPECVKSHGRCARDVMTRDIITVTEDTTLAEIAGIMEVKKVRRVPVLRAGRLVGIVSRGDIVRALVARPEESHGPMTCDDDIVRFDVIDTLMGIPGASGWLTSVSVSKGVVRLDGTVQDESAREPSRLAIAKLPCVVAIEDHRSTLQPY
jgi:CBS domain-containing protein